MASPQIGYNGSEELDLILGKKNLCGSLTPRPNLKGLTPCKKLPLAFAEDWAEKKNQQASEKSQAAKLKLFVFVGRHRIQLSPMESYGWEPKRIPTNPCNIPYQNTKTPNMKRTRET